MITRSGVTTRSASRSSTLSSRKEESDTGKKKTVTEAQFEEREWVEVDGVYIEHDTKRSRFLAHVGSGERPYLSYLIDLSSRTIDIRHTYTPNALRGRGIAHALCNRAFLFAKKNGWEVIPSCSYVSGTYLKRIENEKPSPFEFGK